MEGVLAEPFEIVREPSGARRLLILLHAYTLDSSSLHAIRRAATGSLNGEAGNGSSAPFHGADVLIPDLPYSHFLSLADPIAIARDLLKQIDECWANKCDRSGGEGYESIVFVGHSAGALMARKLYVYACGENDDAPFEPGISSDAHPWAPRVDRIVLLAGMNRGWQISHHMSIGHAISYRLGTVLGNIITHLKKRPPFIFTIRRGASFITQLRLQWLSMIRHVKSKGVGNALTVQLLGTIDDYVGPDDNLDLFTGDDFIYLEVPKSGHSNVIELDDPTAGPDRKDVFLKALVGSKSELELVAVYPLDSPLELNQADVQQVVFVIHGIRDMGYWTRKIAQRVQTFANQKKITLRAVTSTYGYFAMLPFILPSTRRAKVEWLMDQYSQARARYPKAEFSYVGHSNGTYMLAKALMDYPCCRFGNVVFAGSVVRTDYAWKEFHDSGQVKSVLNYVATADWVVAIFPKALQMLQQQDLGSAGHDGFDIVRNSARASQAEHVPEVEFVSEIDYMRGSHGAALVEDNWDAIAEFVLDGRLPASAPPRPLLADERNRFIVFCGSKSPYLWAIGFVVVLLIGWFILCGHLTWIDRPPLRWIHNHFPTLYGRFHTIFRWVRIGGLIVYVWLIKTIVTRV